MYWLSRQGLPRKAGMAASVGTAVHASIEDLLQIDITGKPDSESGWLVEEAERILKLRWEEEKAAFMATPRRPKWKEEKWKDALQHQRGGIIMLLDHVGVRGLEHNRITAALWRRIQSTAIAVEGELKTSDGRLMGRLDLLMADLGEDGKPKGWLVADLKTGRIPDGELKVDVNRQLRMYRDILLANNPDAPQYELKAGTHMTLQSGLRLATMCSKMPMPLGKRRFQPPCPWSQQLVMLRAVDFVIGKPGARIGGSGVMKMARFTKVTSQTRLYFCMNLTHLREQQFLNCVNRSTPKDAPFQQGSNRRLNFLTEGKRHCKRPWHPAIKGLCSLARL